MATSITNRKLRIARPSEGSWVLYVSWEIVIKFFGDSVDRLRSVGQRWVAVWCRYQIAVLELVCRLNSLNFEFDFSKTYELTWVRILVCMVSLIVAEWFGKICVHILKVAGYSGPHILMKSQTSRLSSQCSSHQPVMFHRCSLPASIPRYCRIIGGFLPRHGSRNKTQQVKRKCGVNVTKAVAAATLYPWSQQLERLSWFAAVSCPL